MNYVVLVKQVPDIRHIPRDAWDWETGTLRRGLLENVCNDLDKQALAFALELRGKLPGKIVALSMGPPFAEEVVRYAMSLGVDAGVLLSDRCLGGADTPATAYPLAQAIRRIEREIFEGDRDYLIVAGVQSVDGDTAQVPPQVAEELWIDHVAYVNGFAVDAEGNLALRRVTGGGSETLAVARRPCLVTLTQWTLPPYPTFGRTRWAAGQELARWDADAIGADRERIGLAGSRTSVVKIFSAKSATKRRCVLVTEPAELVALLRQNCTFAENNESPAEVSGAGGYTLPPDKSPDYRGDFWVFAEQDRGRLHPAAFELLGKASEMAATLGEKVAAVVAGAGVRHLAPELIAHGADKVFVVEHERLAQFVAVPYSRALTQLVDRFAPQVMLFSSTPLGRELAPRVAYATASGLTADCTELRIDDVKAGRQERIGILVQTRPALGGNIMASIIARNSRVQMSTARPGVFVALPPDRKRTGEIVAFEPALREEDSGVRIVSVEEAVETGGFGDVPIVVGGGTGCRTKEGFERSVGLLAEGLGKFFGAPAIAGASRQAVEAGFIGRDRQIGQTGQTIAPDLYVALGISGAVQHLTGVQGAKILVAINKDANAPIFRDCDYGIVGSVETVVPELLRALENSSPGELLTANRIDEK